MSQVSELERRYRRLLAWFPKVYRRSHGDEMIGVLLASAHDGQHRPQPAEVLDLTVGGLRILFLHWPGPSASSAFSCFTCLL